MEENRVSTLERQMAWVVVCMIIFAMLFSLLMATLIKEVSKDRIQKVELVEPDAKLVAPAEDGKPRFDEFWEYMKD